MNKEIIKGTFPSYRFVGARHELVVTSPENKMDTADQIYDVVFAPDPFTGLPQSDVAVYLSPKVDPSIRDFIGQNLMSPHPVSDGAPDDQAAVLHDLVRGVDESVSDYVVRVRQIVEADSVTRQKQASVESSKSVD